MAATKALKTRLTTDELEARDTSIEPLSYAIDPIECDGRYQLGDDVTVTSHDGDIFIGHIDEVDEDSLRIYIALD